MKTSKNLGVVMTCLFALSSCRKAELSEDDRADKIEEGGEVEASSRSRDLIGGK
jgi:outer membrane protein assembly factor BamE (lipoprotein component of BamABCDE complex)